MPRRPDDRLPPRTPPRRRSPGGSPGRSGGGPGRRKAAKKKGLSKGAIALIVGVCAAPVLCGVGAVLVNLLTPAIQAAREAAEASRDDPNDLKKIGLALHNYHSTYRAFPSQPRGYSMDGGPGDPALEPGERVAWMTALLPYVDQTALWEELRNRPVAAFDDPSLAEIYATPVPAFQRGLPEPLPGGLAPAHFAGNAWFLGASQDAGMRDLRDGTTVTLLAGEVNIDSGAPAAWGDPDNLREPSAPLNSPTGFGGNRAAGAEILMGDGSVRFLSPSVDPAVLRALGTPAGGEPVGGF